MKRYVCFVAIAAVALVIVAIPAFAISGVNGDATNSNTILRVKIENTIVKLASDVAESLNTTTLKATSSFLSGQVGDFPIPGGKTKTATKASESGSDTLPAGVTKTVPGLASIKLQGGKVAANITNTKVSSAVDFAVGQVNALAGFTTIGTTSSSTDSSVGVNSSTVSRDVSIGDVNVLNLRDLLDQFGVDPLEMACDAIEATGHELGQDAVTGTACSQLDDITAPVTGAIPVGLGEIDDTETVLGALSTALGLICVGPLATACDTVTPLISTATSDIDAIQADPGATCAIVDEQLATVTSDVEAVLAELNVLNGVGGALDGLLGGVLAPVSSQVDALGTATDALDTACNTLAGVIDDLLDTSLLSLDLIKVTMDLAAKTTPAAVATGTIGSLKVGNLTVVDANDLVALGGQLNAAIDTVESTLGDVFAATGLGLHAPVLDLLKVTTSKGKNAAGSYFANAAMTVAHVGIPSATLNLPASLPLGALSGIGSFAPASVRLAAINTPAVFVDAGVFSGSATYKAGSVLPVTGVSDSGLIFAGLLTLIGAGMVRRLTTIFN
jgi:hypothetical protein